MKSNIKNKNTTKNADYNESDIKYTWLLRHDGEYTTAPVFNTISACIRNALQYFENCPPTYSIIIQELVPYKIHISGESFLDNLWSDVELEVGDLADDWLNGYADYTDEQLNTLSERLTGVVNNWLEETDNKPPFYRILSEKEVQLCNIPQ